jgi:hypothetical protein
VSNLRNNGNGGMPRGKSTPVINSVGNSNVAHGGGALQQKGNINNLANQHPTMVGASTAHFDGRESKTRSVEKGN